MDIGMDLESKMRFSRLSLMEVTVKSEGDFYRDNWFYTLKKEQDGAVFMTCRGTEGGMCLDMDRCSVNRLEMDNIKKLLPSGIGQKEEPVVEKTPVGHRIRTVILKWSDGSETNPQDAFEVLRAYLIELAKKQADEKGMMGGPGMMRDGPGMMRQPEMPMGNMGMASMGMLTGGMAMMGMSETANRQNGNKPAEENRAADSLETKRAGIAEQMSDNKR